MVARPSRSSARAIKMPPQATFGAHLCAVRILFFCYLQKNNIRIQRSQALRVFRAAALKRFWVLLAGQKYHPTGRRRNYTTIEALPRRQETANQAKDIPKLSPSLPLLIHSKRLPVSRQGALFLHLTFSRTVHALHRWCAGYGAPDGCPARPDSRRTAPSPRGSRDSCAASSPRPRGTAPLPAESADR